MKHYSALRDKKMVVLGLASLLGLPADQTPPEVAAGQGQVLTALLRVLLALKKQQEEQEARGSGEEEEGEKGGKGGGSSGNESDSEGDSGLGSDDDEVDEAYLR